MQNTIWAAVWRSLTFWPLAVLSVVGARPAPAQLPDARVLPGGVLRFSFTPFYQNYDRRFALNTPGVADGTEEPLGTDLTADTVGLNFFPSLAAPQSEIRSLIGDDTYRLNLGGFDTKLDADIRRFPLALAIGITDRITFSVNVPIVTARMNATLTVDSTGNVGWNPVSPFSGITDGAAQVTTLLTELGQSASFLTDGIAQGQFGCPSGPDCQSAESLLAQTLSTLAGLQALTGLGPDGSTATILPPVVPLSGSEAGTAITANLDQLSTDLAALGVPGLSSTLPLPDSTLSASDIESLLADPAFGYSAFGLETTKLSRLGDIELGLRVGLASSENLRAVLKTTVRLPTGTRDATNHFVDLGTGDRQTDLEPGIELSLGKGGLGVAVDARYTLQMADQRPRRIAPPNRPIALAADEFIVDRNLGDILWLSVYPHLDLTEGLTVFASANYYDKGSDTFSVTSPISTVGGATVSDLELETSMTAWSFGGGLSFRSTGQGPGGLPVEAGLEYRSTFTGSGGATPKRNTLTLYLRFFSRLFGAQPEPEPEPEPEPDTEEAPEG